MRPVFPLPQQTRLIDYGTAPVISVCGVARVDILGGITRLALFDMKNTLIDGTADRYREVTYNLILPTEAVAPMVERVIIAFGPRLVLPPGLVM